MNFFKVTILPLFIFLSVFSHWTFAARDGEEKSITNPEVVEIIVQIDETKATPAQQKALEVLKPQATDESKTVSYLSRENVHKIVNVVNDLTTMGAASLYIISRATSFTEAFSIGNMIFPFNL